MTVIYFGCIDRAGHYFWGFDRRLNGLTNPSPWEKVDGTLTPKSTKAQSAAALHHLDGWTALALHDYTVDSRGNSNSLFLIDHDLGLDAAIEAARKVWPSVVARIEAAAPIFLAEDG